MMCGNSLITSWGSISSNNFNIVGEARELFITFSGIFDTIRGSVFLLAMFLFALNTIHVNIILKFLHIKDYKRLCFKRSVNSITLQATTQFKKF